MPNGETPQIVHILAPERTVGVLLGAKIADFLVGYLPKPKNGKNIFSFSKVLKIQLSRVNKSFFYILSLKKRATNLKPIPVNKICLFGISMTYRIFLISSQFLVDGLKTQL